MYQKIFSTVFIRSVTVYCIRKYKLLHAAILKSYIDWIKLTCCIRWIGEVLCCKLPGGNKWTSPRCEMTTLLNCLLSNSKIRALFMTSPEMIPTNPLSTCFLLLFHLPPTWIIAWPSCNKGSKSADRKNFTLWLKRVFKQVLTVIR